MFIRKFYLNTLSEIFADLMKIFTQLLILSSIILSGCSVENPRSEIVTTIYPFKAIIKEIVGDKVEVKAVLPSGADPHTYEMLPSDFKTIQNASAFFFGSEALDGWASKIEVKNKTELITLVPEEYQIEISLNDASQDHHHSHITRNESYIIDPHFWVDPVTVNAMINNLVKEITKIFPDEAEYFRYNAKNFSDQLTELNKEIIHETSDIRNRSVFTAHPFYSYFFQRYGFTVAGSIEIAPGYHSTPKDIKQLMELVKKQDVKAIFTHKQHSDKPAKVLAEATGIADYELDPVGGVPGRISYKEIILYNLDIIKKAVK